MKFEFPRHIFEKYTNIKFYENPSTGNRAVSCGRTDGRTDVQAERCTARHSEVNTVVAFRYCVCKIKNNYGIIEETIDGF